MQNPHYCQCKHGNMCCHLRSHEESARMAIKPNIFASKVMCGNYRYTSLGHSLLFYIPSTCKGKTGFNHPKEDSSRPNAKVHSGAVTAIVKDLYFSGNYASCSTTRLLNIFEKTRIRTVCPCLLFVLTIARAQVTSTSSLL